MICAQFTKASQLVFRNENLRVRPVKRQVLINAAVTGHVPSDRLTLANER
jgi:hypothetical protein